MFSGRVCFLHYSYPATLMTASSHMPLQSFISLQMTWICYQPDIQWRWICIQDSWPNGVLITACSLTPKIQWLNFRRLSVVHVFWTALWIIHKRSPCTKWTTLINSLCFDYQLRMFNMKILIQFFSTVIVIVHLYNCLVCFGYYIWQSTTMNTLDSWKLLPLIPIYYFLQTRKRTRK